LTLFDFKKQKAAGLHKQGQARSAEGDRDGAISAYLQALALDPEKSASHYNLGLLYKYEGDWERSFEHNLAANRLEPDDQAARWNLAIAATALGRWEVVRRTWQAEGITLDGNSGPIDMDFGITPVRLNPHGDGEVVWARRVDPVRARIESVPMPASGFRYGDIVLNDGAPEGTRTAGNREYAVFNVLALLQASTFETAVATIEVTSDAEVQSLDAILTHAGHVMEDWTANVRSLCKQCSEGRPHEAHDTALPSEWQAQRELGIAVFTGAPIDAPAVFRRWQDSTGAQLLSFEIVPRHSQDD
jgi:tetratricopeptide (TPR) repeat protein